MAVLRVPLVSRKNRWLCVDPLPSTREKARESPSGSVALNSVSVVPIDKFSLKARDPVKLRSIGVLFTPIPIAPAAIGSNPSGHLVSEL